MMTLVDLLKPHVDGCDIQCEVSGLAMDSRLVQKGFLFFALHGTHQDGKTYIADAIHRGAAAILIERDKNTPHRDEGCFITFQDNIPIISVPALRSKIGKIAAQFYGYPTKSLRVIGITGTNGKTSCSHFIARTLTNVGIPCAVSGTLGNGLLTNLKSTGLTTPDPIALQAFFAEMVREGVKAVAMEVSSHSLDQARIEGIEFEIVLFTNLTQDHLDYHQTMAAYGDAKRKLFTHYPWRYAVINADDAFGASLIRALPEEKVISFSIQKNSMAKRAVIADDIHLDLKGFNARLFSPWGEHEISAPLIGLFNVSNVTAVFTVFCLMQVPMPSILKSIRELMAVPGRMEILGGGASPLVVVDYAHTPDALKNALTALRGHCQGQLYCLFGCGGDRDRSKRPLMAATVETYADSVMVTDDNPRTENPAVIIQDILKGFSKVATIKIEHNRSKAIRDIIHYASSGDCVLIAGKGAETYQQIGHEKIPFSDVEQVKESLQC